MRSFSARAFAAAALLASVAAATTSLPRPSAAVALKLRGGKRDPVAVIRGGATTKAGAPAAKPLSAYPKPGTNSATASTISLVKNIVGAGMLALPAGMAAAKGTGFLPAIGIVLVSCLLSAYSFTLVGRACEVTGASDFRDLWSLTLGAKSAWAVDFMIMGVAGGALLIYGCFLGELLSALTNSALSRTSAIITCAATLLPLALLEDLSALAPVSVVGVGAIVYSALFIILRFIDGSCSPGGKFFDVLPVAPSLDIVSQSRISLGTCVLFNMLLTAYMAHTNAVRFYNELEDRSPKKFNSVVTTAFLASALVYVLVMSAGFLTFGKASQGLILSNYASSDKLAFAGRMATFVSIMSSHPLLFTSFRDVVLSTLKASGLPSMPTFAPSSGSWRALSVAMLAMFTIVAIVTTDVGFVVSINGALFGSGLIFCVPTAIFLAAMKNGGEKGPLRATTTGKEVGAMHFLFLFGLLAATFGTTITCLETFTDILG